MSNPHKGVYRSLTFDLAQAGEPKRLFTLLREVRMPAPVATPNTAGSRLKVRGKETVREPSLAKFEFEALLA
jgi:hypothetical protein